MNDQFVFSFQEFKSIWQTNSLIVGCFLRMAPSREEEEKESFDPPKTHPYLPRARFEATQSGSIILQAHQHSSGSDAAPPPHSRCPSEQPSTKPAFSSLPACPNRRGICQPATDAYATRTSISTSIATS